MNTADYVDSLIADLKQQVANGGIPISEACWQTALACVGWSYVYSAWGALCTPSERRKRFNMCPSHTTIKTKCKGFENGVCTGCQWYPDGQRTRCYDCRGFTDWILKQFGFDLYGDTCGAQWNHKDNWLVKGQIGVDPMPQNVLINVFIYKDGKFTHTGLYYNGSTCECSSGVQYFEKMKANRWTHWAIAKCFANGYQMPADPPKEPAKEPAKQPEKGETPVSSRKTIRKGNYGALVKECQTMLQKLGYSLGVCGVDSDFGQATEKAVKQFQKDHGLAQDGVVGPKTWDALQKAVDSQTAPPPVVYYDVTVTHVTKDVADEIVGKYGGKIVAE